MDLLKWISGSVSIEIVSADPAGLLRVINGENIPVFDVKTLDDLTILLQVYRQDYLRLQMLLERRGERCTVKHKSGMYWKLKQLLKRPVFAVLLISLLCVSLFLPSRILFVRVVGNQIVPDNLILENAQLCGIYFGASRRQIRSEQVKNALIAKIPQLQWVGVNTSGCVATVNVREKSDMQTEIQKERVANIIAARDGVICDMTVLQGAPVCKIGQAVQKGQTLVSGYTDCGIMIKATRANADVFAQTNRKITVIVPNKTAARGRATRRRRTYALNIGKNIINFCNDSGILGSSCVKMYDEYAVTLPGGFQLPLSLICQTYIYYDSAALTVADNYDWLADFTKNYTLQQMVAGKIMSGEYTTKEHVGAYRLDADFSCIEMIGQVKNEESLQNYGKNS